MGLWATIKQRATRRRRIAAEVELMRAIAGAKRINARYDAATRGGDLERYWQNADNFDADSANRREVRELMVHRSRYELANNGYADGIAQTYASDLVGPGPLLRMQTGSVNFNQMVELRFYEWSEEVRLRAKLWTMAHAKHGDGEAFAIMGINRRMKHPINLDISLRETEQCQNPLYIANEPDFVDGIHFDPEWGTPLSYDFLTTHPGSQQRGIARETRRVDAANVLHWFKLRRPGQHRGVPECASTLNLGAAFRRLREASLSTAEKVAAWTMFLKTMYQPDELQPVAMMSTMDINHGMMTALPNSVEPVQLRAEHPGASYDSFHKSLLNEQARPKSMPYNKAACDSSSYNYASGRLDHQTYYGHLDGDRLDCNDLVMNRIFEMWFTMAIKTFKWLGGDPYNVGIPARAHLWDWPKHRVADVEAEANSNRTRLESGQTFFHRLFSDNGMDFDDECDAAAESFGIEVDDLKARILEKYWPKPQAPAPPGGGFGVAAPPESEAIAARLLNRIPTNGHAKKLAAVGAVEAGFCPTGPGGGIDNSCGRNGEGGTDTDKNGDSPNGKDKDDKSGSGRASKVASKIEYAITSEDTTPPPPGDYLKPEVERDANGDGITEASRVGVCAECVDNKVPRLPNLNPEERRVEREFADAFEANPEGMSDKIRAAAVARAAEKGGPVTFETDAAKNCYGPWKGEGMSEEERSHFRATMNTPLHQTANVATKHAFVSHLDTLKPGDEIMVTVGGCGAGKGFALDPSQNVTPALEMKSRASVVWDSAGDQNATENTWILKEAEARDLKVSFLYVHADPEKRWADPKSGVVQRAMKPSDGRMVDARVFADSYAIGARNHAAFYEREKDNERASFVFVDASSGKPTAVDSMPSAALAVDRNELYEFARTTVVGAQASEYVKRGALIGSRIWKDEIIYSE